MLLSRQLADFTRGESDTLRKAMGKKLIEKLNHMYPKFIEAERRMATTRKCWKRFGRTGKSLHHTHSINRMPPVTRGYLSDSLSESQLSGRVHAATMSRNISNITEITKLMDESKATGITTKGPDVNESYLKFSVNRKGDIRFGLGASRA